MREDWVEIISNDLTIDAKNAIVDGPFGTQLKVHEFKSEGIPVIEMDNIKGDSFKNEFRRFVNEEKYEQIKRSTVIPGDLLISKTGSLGYVAFAPNIFDKAVITSRLAKMSLKWEYLNPKYFKYWLIHLRETGYWEKVAKGTTMKILGIPQLKNIPIPLPPLPIQRTIVQKIESYFDLLDKGIADLKTAQEQLKIYRQAVLKKAFEGEFTKEWRENTKWSIITFEEITESLKRGPFGGDLKKEYFVKNGYAVYEQQHAINNDFTNIRYFINEERYNLLKACNANPGDYIVSCSGTIGKIARIPEGAPKGVINQALLRIRINGNIIIHKYFVEFFRSHVFQKKILRDSRGTGMQNMAGIKEIKPIKINLPSINEQHAIVREIESRLSVCDKVEQSISESLEKAEALRQSILKKAFEGKLLSGEEIAQCKQEADYEPASVLLERIRKENKHGKQNRNI